MKRTTIFLPDEVHKGLKYLALDHNVSMAELLREAVESVYKEDLHDVRAAGRARKAHRKNTATAVDAHQYFQRRKKA